MNDRVRYRLGDMRDALAQIESLLSEKSIADLVADRAMKAAYERFLEILSEASRHIPESLKITEPGIEWRKIADIGNVLRHAYNRVDAEIIWRLHEDGKLAELRDACGRLLERLAETPD